MNPTSFVELGLTEPLIRALEAACHSVPTPIQTKAIPPVLAGRDLLGIAQTGTGKTAAFALPLLQRLAATQARPLPGRPRALILAPTRELAAQIASSLATYGRHMKLAHTLVVGGVAQGPQRKAMRRPVDLLVATPGRLLDLMTQGHVELNHVAHLVIDEADRMLDMGFVRDVRKIVAALPAKRQGLLFSATMPTDVERLAAQMLADPVRVEVTPRVKTVERIDQYVMHVAVKQKRAALTKLLEDPTLSRVIVFARTKHGANRTAEHLDETGIPATALHGNKTQSARERALEHFKSGKARVLVATDIAARGIDVQGVSHVINLDVPNVAETYVHRIGRTARAGAAGVAISLCDSSEAADLRGIEKLIGRRLDIMGRGEGDTSRSTVHTDAMEPRIPAKLKRRGPVVGDLRKRPTTSSNMPTGTVKWFNAKRGFGVIQPDDGGEEVFVHISAVKIAGIGHPAEGQKLRYDIQFKSKSGRRSATNLRAA